jgi:hypothetical protein
MSASFDPSSTWTADKLNDILAQMAGEENRTLTPRDEDEDEGLGFGFFLKIAGVCVVGGLPVFGPFFDFLACGLRLGLFRRAPRSRGGAVPVRLALGSP